jgi:A/G-specific adenine glycosylase
MLGLPTSDWGARPLNPGQVLTAAPVAGDWRCVGEIDHVFTHFGLTLQIWRRDGSADLDDAVWTPRADLAALPSVFLKAAKAGLDRLI